MAEQLPEAAHRILNEEQPFFKRDKPVVDRLKNSTDYGFLFALNKIDAIIREHFPFNSHSRESIFADPYSGQWQVFLDYLVTCSTNYTQENADGIRKAHKDYAEKLEAIIKAADELSKQIKLAEMIGERFGLSVNADVHPLGLLQNAIENQADSETRFRHNQWVGDTIRQARSFDLKYHPSITNLIDEISRQYSQDYESTNFASVKKQTSKANDFFCHFFDSLKHSIELNQISSTILDSKVITLSNWSDIFRVALDVTVTEQNLKDYRNPRKK
jgi:hypothetical protein